MFFKRLEKQLDELQKTLNKVSDISDINTRDRLNNAYSIMETSLSSLETIILCEKRNEKGSFISMCAAEKLLEKLFRAKELIGEVIGEGGESDE